MIKKKKKNKWNRLKNRFQGAKLFIYFFLFIIKLKGYAKTKTKQMQMKIKYEKSELFFYKQNKNLQIRTSRQKLFNNSNNKKPYEITKKNTN